VTAGEVRAVRGLVGEVLDDLGAIERIEAEWRELAISAAATPFESPDWLLPWFRWYGDGLDPCVLTWRRDGRLVAVAPLVRWAAGRIAPVAQVAFWAGSGPALRGMVDLVAEPDSREAATDALGAWLRAEASGWDLLHVLRLPAGSPTPSRLITWARAAGWRRVRLTGVVRSETWILDLPHGDGEWRSLLGSKARHNLRTEERRFARAGGSYEVVTDPAEAVQLPAILRRLATDRWGAAEVNFGPDPAFQPFLEDVFERMSAAGTMYANVARDPSGIRACLVTFTVGDRATAVLIGVSTADDVRKLSLGKHLFDASIGEAIARGCATYDFLWEGGYKESFWRAAPRTLESFVVGRGPGGQAGVAWVGLRRRLLPAIARRVGRVRRGAAA
jgi:CelD/BcsL family acetyltransferase involved in cellulose biosynthesis